MCNDEKAPLKESGQSMASMASERARHKLVVGGTDMCKCLHHLLNIELTVLVVLRCNMLVVYQS